MVAGLSRARIMAELRRCGLQLIFAQPQPHYYAPLLHRKFVHFYLNTTSKEVSVLGLSIMEPLSVTMAIVGLLKAAEQISSTLQPLIKKATNAPKEMKQMKSSVDGIRTVLSQLQSMLMGRSQVGRDRTSLILVEQIVITLSACVTTFSELDIFVETLGTDSNMGLLDRLRWATKTSTIQEHMQKLEVHKSTLTLMMTILTW
jgi:hypothetical protein